MPSSRRYTDDEVHSIFERAAAKQEEAQRAESASRAGLTLQELQEIGSEAGIDPSHIALAASEVSVRGADTSAEQQQLFGIPTRIGDSRRIEGHIGDEEWEQIVHELRNIFGRDGIAGELGRSREWTVTSRVGRFDRPVTVIPDEHGTLVTIDQEMKGQAIGLSIGTGVFYLAMALFILLMNLFTASGQPPLGIAFMFLGMAGLFFGGTLEGTRYYAMKQCTKFTRALDRIELITGRTQVDSDTGPQREAPQPEIDLEALPDTEEQLLRGTSERRGERN